MRSSTRSTGRQRARSPGTSSAPTCNWSMPRKKIPTSAPERYANHTHFLNESDGYMSSYEGIAYMPLNTFSRSSHVRLLAQSERTSTGPGTGPGPI